MLRDLGRWVLTFEPPKLLERLPTQAATVLPLQGLPLLSNAGPTRNYFLSTLLMSGPAHVVFLSIVIFLIKSTLTAGPKIAISIIGGFIALSILAVTVFWLPHAYRMKPSSSKELVAGCFTILSMVSGVATAMLYLFARDIANWLNAS